MVKLHIFVATIFDLNSEWFDLDPIGEEEYVHAIDRHSACLILAERLNRPEYYCTAEVKYDSIVKCYYVESVTLLSKPGMHRYRYTYTTS